MKEETKELKTTLTQKINKEIDAAYAAWKSGEPGADNRLYQAIKKLAEISMWSFGILDPDLPREIASKAIERQGQFRGESRFSTWVGTLARNECRLFLRDEVIPERQKLESISIYEEPESEESRPKKVPEGLRVHPASTAGRDLEKVLEGLPPEQLRVIDFYLEGYSLEETAAKTGEPLGTIRSRYRLAKEKLQKKLARNPEEVDAE